MKIVIDKDSIINAFAISFYALSGGDYNTVKDAVNELLEKSHYEPYEARPQGEWIHRRIIAKDRSFDMVVCSNCHTEFSYDAETGVCMDNYNTCPNCTADMRKGEGE